AEMSERLRSVPGRLPPVQVWSEGAVAYEGQVFSHAGRLWQARCDTGFRPDARHADWGCLARTFAPSVSLGELGRHDAQRARDEVAKIAAELRTEVDQKIASLSGRPVCDQNQADHVLADAVARTRAEMRAELDRALDAQRREFLVQVEAL